MQRVAILLHNVRSAHNVGSIFRTADAAGVGRIYLTGYTPTPTDRFGRVQREIAKTALGATNTVPWTYVKNPSGLVEQLSREGWQIVGVEQEARARPYAEYHYRAPTLFLFGNEVRGLSKPLRDHCDELIEIPMRGAKESLNVSVAVGIILFSSLFGR